MNASRVGLAPYLPRLLLDWQRETPSASVREIAGTMVFVDISGFTAMSERLAGQGKVGSEEVTEVLDSVFTRLLAVAYADGGSLLKFGGDALLLLFDGAGHAVRGVHAAAGMRRELRETGAIPTSAGQIRLRMSVGVHSGRFLLALAGRRHRELVVTGPAASRTVEMEHAADAGDVLLSPETAAALDPSLLGEPKGPGILLRRSPAPPRVASSAPARADGVAVADFVPVALRDHLAAGGGAPEHRQVSVGFVRFTGVDALVADGGAAAVFEALDALMSTVQDAAAAYGVTVLGSDVDVDGGKVILVAGAPHAGDGDEERLLRAARDVVESEIPLGVRVGVHRGHVFVGDVGPAYRRTFTVMGDAVNLAARLMAHAAPRDVVASADTLDRVPVAVDAQPLPPFTVKGKRHEVSAARVLGVGGTRRADPGALLELVGRERELTTLLDAAGDARGGRRRVVDVVGDPGIGKTRLVQELLARATVPVRAVACCSAYDAATPYAVVRSVLRSLLGIDESADPVAAGEALRDAVAALDERLLPWLPLIAIPVGATVPSTLESETVAAEFRPARMRRAVADLVAAIAAPGAVVVVEDVHWADDASAEVLRHLTTAVPDDAPLLLVLTRRGDGPAYADGDDLVVLGRLGPADAKRLAVVASEGLLLAETLLDVVAARSEGSPLFLRELVRTVAESGSADALPDTVEAVVTARLDALRADDRALLRHAAVLGVTFPAEMLETVLGSTPDAPTWRRLSPFLERGDDGTVRFRQALFHDVAYEGLPFRTRRALHARAGEAVMATTSDADDAAALLSLHFHRAQVWERSWHFSRVAGRRAQETFANVEAATFLRRAIEASGRLDVTPVDVAAVWESLGDVLHLSGMYAESSTAFASARRLAPPSALPALMLKEGVVRERLGRYPQALRWFTRALRMAAVDGSDEALSRHRVRIRLAVAITRHRQGNYRECIRLCKQVVQEAEALEDNASLAYAYFLLHTAYGDLGTPEFEDFQGRALPLFEALGDLVGQSNVLERLGIDAYYAGRWDEAADYYRRSAELRERAGHVVYAANSAHNVAEIRLDQGHPEQAVDGFRHALRVWRSAGFAHGVVFAMCALGRVDMLAGRYADAQRQFAEAEATAAEIGAEHALVEVEGRRAELELAMGLPEAARVTVDAALERAARVGGMTEITTRLQRVLAASLLACGEVGAAAEVLDAILGDEDRASYEVGLALRLRARVASAVGGDPTPFLTRARAMLDALGVVDDSAAGVPDLAGSSG